MGKRRKWQSVLLVTLWASAAGCALAMPYLQNDNARRPTPQPIRQEDSAVAAQPLVVEEDTIPDSLLNARWRIQPTIPLTQDDLDRIPADLRTPDNIQYNVDDGRNMAFHTHPDVPRRVWTMDGAAAA